MKEKTGNGISKWKTAFLFLAVSAVFIGLDQWTKLLAVSHLEGKPSRPLIPGVFEFSYTVNYGAAFGILQNRQLLFYITTPVILAAVFCLYLRVPAGKRYLPLKWVGVLLCSGAAGNLIDRAARGYVVDFLYFKLIDFPVFNVADCYVTIATAVLFVLILFVYKEDELGFFKMWEKRPDI